MDKVNTKKRISKIRESLVELKLDAIVILSVENRIYFSQFSGSSGAIIITIDETLLLTDSRYSEQAIQQAKDFDVVRHKGLLIDDVCEVLKHRKINSIGIEGSMTLSAFRSLEKGMDSGKFSVLDPYIMKIRQIKDDYEISCIEKGIQLCDQAFAHIINYIQPGITEKQIGLEIEYFLKKNGADQIKGNQVIASGERSALPHGLATNRIVNEGEFVKMDIGAIIDGYYSDFTRTIVVGEPSNKQREIYQIVFEASEATLKEIAPGKKASEIDEIGRSFIRNAGYGDFFGHGLGHSLGLNLHESPFLRAGENIQLEEGMVITVEPGIYLPGECGVRIEDLIVITKDGHINLTTSTKELLIIPVSTNHMIKG